MPILVPRTTRKSLDGDAQRIPVVFHLEQIDVFAVGRGCAGTVEKLLLEPTEQLKALPDEETQVAYTEAVNRLFRLGDGETAAPASDKADASSLDETGDATRERRSVPADRRRGT